jgi:hypothetical protein
VGQGLRSARARTTADGKLKAISHPSTIGQPIMILLYKEES